MSSSLDPIKNQLIAALPQTELQLAARAGICRDGMDANGAEKLRWQISIADLMKLLELDPSLSNLTQLAREPDVPGRQRRVHRDECLALWRHSSPVPSDSER
jgi:hypothetical protein